MYSGSPPTGRTPHGGHKHIDDSQVVEFAALIEESQADEWQRRTQALQQLVDSIPEGSAYIDNGPAWYNTPATLRHLAISVSELLKDPRSTVVKRTCESLTRLFGRCQIEARYLFKDIMPVILSVHAQTVQVIRQAVQNMVLESIPEVPCKMVMPLWMERLKVDKSRTVRDACALYIGQALQSWTEEGYLTQEIWLQVGAVLIRALRDPSPQVRTHSKTALVQLRATQPHVWHQLMDGPAAKGDPKLQRWLKTLDDTNSADPEELSVSSKYSYNSDTRFARARSSPRRNLYGMPGLGLGQDMESASRGYNIPSSIAVVASNGSHAQQQPRSGLGPPLRMNQHTNKPFEKVMESPPRVQGTPPRAPPPPPPPPRQTHSFDDAKEYLKSKSGSRSFDSSDSDIAVTASKSVDDADVVAAKKVEVANKTEFPSNLKQTLHEDAPLAEPAKLDFGMNNNEGPFIASMQQLKKHASKRRSRNSLLMQERFRMSGNLLGTAGSHDEDDVPTKDEDDMAKKRSEEENEVPNESMVSGGNKVATSKVQTPQAPEHMVIAIRLLRAHKEHVDHIMETLKIEMDTLRDFDKLLEEPGRPTEEEVLDYFEAVGLCLDQRTTASSAMQKEMDRISRGEPPQE